jgi:cytochrome c oxidase assembly factor CtaG/putative copper export protein
MWSAPLPCVRDGWPGSDPHRAEYHRMVTRTMRVAGPAVLVGAALVSVLAALAFGGGAAAEPLIDPGAVTRYGLPIAKLLMNLGVGVALGALALAVFALRPSPAAGTAGAKGDEFGSALDIAAAGAGVWTVAAAASALLAYSSVSYIPISFDDAYGQGLGVFLTQTSPGRAWLITTLLGAALTVLCFAVRNVTALGFVIVLAVLGLIPLAREGHAGDTASHDSAVTAIWLHVLFAGFWLGGLIAVTLLRSRLSPERLAAVLPRYSTIALICFVVVAASGYLSASIRVATPENLLTPYGVLVLAKVAALGALGLFGASQRRILIDRIASGGPPRWFWMMVAAELAFMGVASGVAAALARTNPPVDDVPTTELPDPTPALVLTDRELPPELTPVTWVTQWNLDLLWLLVCGFGLFFYLAGVARLRRRGDRWPWYRTALWVSGILLLFWVTNGPINVYERYLFSTHMLGHMLLSMAVPVLLVLSAPITLAMRTIRKRDDGSRGAREWVMLAVHSRVAAVLTHPLVAGGMFAASLWIFYYSPLFRWATEDHVGHTWMTVHFVITGYLFAQTLVGIDPVAGRPPYPLRLLLLLATMAMHAFFGLSLVTGTGLLLSDWYGAMGRTWGLAPLADQQAGGGIAWSVGELPTVALAILVAVLWSRSDQRDAHRGDRAADRDGDAELAAYNRMLAGRSSGSKG